MNDGHEWDGVTERREGERREHGPPQQVELAHLSNGARDFVLSLDKRLSVLSKLLGWAVAVSLPIGLAAVAGIWSMSGKVESLAADVEYRPTRPAIEEMIDRRTEEIRDQVIETSAESELAKQMGSEGLNSLSASIRVLEEQHGALRRDFEREHGNHRTEP